MKLSEKPEIVHFPETHYLYVAKTGPFQDTAMECWKAVHAEREKLIASGQVKTFFSTYRFEPEMFYRAGVALKEKPSVIPQNFAYEYFKGGRYACFTLHGPYDQLPEASGLVFERAEEQGIEFGEGFFIEHYVNDPSQVKAEDLITEILLPLKT